MENEPQSIKVNTSSPFIFHLSFLLILAVAIGLRLWNAGDFYLSNDEHSALVRLDFDSVNMLVNEGIKPDGHPAGVQLFLYGWTKLFGDDPWTIRLPFLMLGLLGLWYGWLLARKWFGNSVAIMATALMATSSYVILNHLAARPYAAGFCFVLGLAWYQEQLVDRGRKRDIIRVALFAALCAYTHYFAALQAVLIAVVGLVTNRTKQQQKSLIISYIGALVLYLPHIPVFFTQLKTGGIGGWLSPPTPGLLFDWFQIGLNGLLPIALVLMLILTFRFFAKSLVSRRGGPLLTAFILGFSPFIIGYAYSSLRDPLLHLGSLFFSFPFALIAILGAFGEIKSKTLNLVLCLMILAIGTSSLIGIRKHYRLFHARGTGQLAHMLAKQKPQGLASVASANNPEYVRYHLRRIAPERDFDQYDPGNYVSFRRWAADSSHKRLLWAWAGKPMDLNYAAIAREIFPRVIETQWKPTTEIMLLEKTKRRKKPPKNRVYMDENIEYGPEHASLLIDQTDCRHNILHVWADFRIFEMPDPDLQLAVSLIHENNGEQLVWESIKLSQFTDSLRLGEWQRVHFTKRMRYMMEPPYNHVGLRAHIWNPGGSTFELRGAPQVEVWKGNPSVYAFLEWVDPCRKSFLRDIEQERAREEHAILWHAPPKSSFSH
jgi:hypothetical protein